MAVFDNRGVGGSYRTAKMMKANHHWTDYRDSVLDLMDHLQWSQAVIMGHSMGGMISQRCLVDYPTRFVGAILLGTAHGSPSISKWPPEINVVQEFQKPVESIEQVLRNNIEWNVTPEWAQSHQREVDQLLKVSRSRVRPLKGITMQLMAMSEMVPANIEAITVPTLVIHGDRDRIIDVHCGQELHDRIPQSELAIMKDTGHTPMLMGGIGEMARTILSFLHRRVDKSEIPSKL